MLVQLALRYLSWTFPCTLNWLVIFRVYIFTNQSKLTLTPASVSNPCLYFLNVVVQGTPCERSVYRRYGLKHIMWKIQVKKFHVCTTNCKTITSSSFPWRHFLYFSFHFISSILSYVAHSICVKFSSFVFHLRLNYH